jgi:hypothetical protein
LDLSGSQVFGWFVLPHARSEYSGSGANSAGRQQLIDWGKAAATAAGVDLTKFFGVVVSMNISTDLFGFIGYPAVACDNGSMEPSWLGQEMLHGYGLNHARLNGNLADYQDPFDIMSVDVWPTFLAPDPNFGHIGPGLNAALMDTKGWLDPERVWAYSGGGGTVQLRPHHRRDLPGFLVAKVGPYYAEFRMNEGYDAQIQNFGGVPGPAVLIHRFDPDGHSYLMQSTAGTTSLITGGAFEGPVGASPIRLAVNVTGIDPTNRLATLSVSTKGLLQIVVTPSPTPLGTPITLKIDAFDQSTGQALTGGTVKLSFADDSHSPQSITFQTGVSQPITLNTWPQAHVDAKGHITVTTQYPSGTVSVPGFAVAGIPFTFKGS